MNDPIPNAKAEIDRLEAAVRQHDEAIAHYTALKAQALDEVTQIKRFIQMFERFSRGDDPVDSHQTTKAATVTVTERLVRIATQINRDGRRARTEDILRIASGEGISIGGADEQAKKNSIAGTLSRTGSFDAKRGHGYWLKSLGVPPDGDGGSDTDSDDEPAMTEAKTGENMMEFMASQTK